MTEAAATAKAFLGAEKASLDWQLPAENRPKQHVKLLLNMVLMVLAAMPRGGVITVTAQGEGFAARAKGERARVPAAVAQVLDGIADLASLDARLVQPYYTRLLAAATGLTLAMAMDGDDVVVIASRGGTSS
jgi:histidine phosphotransferase ChpT